jgi:hypothetical protein
MSDPTGACLFIGNSPISRLYTHSTQWYGVYCSWVGGASIIESLGIFLLCFYRERDQTASQLSEEKRASSINIFKTLLCVCVCRHWLAGPAKRFSSRLPNSDIWLLICVRACVCVCLWSLTADRPTWTGACHLPSRAIIPSRLEAFICFCLFSVSRSVTWRWRRLKRCRHCEKKQSSRNHWTASVLKETQYYQKDPTRYYYPPPIHPAPYIYLLYRCAAEYKHIQLKECFFFSFSFLFREQGGSGGAYRLQKSLQRNRSPVLCTILFSPHSFDRPNIAKRKQTTAKKIFFFFFFLPRFL